MFESIRKSSEKQNELLEEILEKGSLESVLKDINPIEPSVTSLYMDPYNYDETKRCVNGNIGERILEIVRLYGEIKYLTEVVPKQYETFKHIKQETKRYKWICYSKL
ncbi:hypothetical protein [Candidatus Nanosynbacter sp. TM7-057]|uniref:hypothetical protein n=1 Tax=Candidatus Nanosynbacter sp. TM7-057 TaxID=2902630 RepID=UPI001FB69911|nr:hypothetical protein [Candidatus Nanosynbacter sp. TM7-057]MCJ1965186.1 hypothetical protein [Candidatus Nanosynbacter sp. TM7-057]